MKKLISIILAIISVFAFVGCNPETPHTDPTYPAPWSTDTVNAHLAYEKCTYAIEKTNKATGDIVATGEVVYELAPAGADGETPLSRLKMTMSITFTDKAVEADRGKTDTISSEAIFSAKSLTPFSSKRTVTLEDRDGIDNFGYTLNNDYVAGTSTISYHDGKTADHTLNFNGANLVGVMDNEVMFYYVRAYPAITNGTYGYFRLADFYDMHPTNAFSPVQMSFNCNAEGEDESIILNGLDGFLEDNSVATLRAAVGKNVDLSGPAIQLYMSKTPFTISEGVTTKNVIVRIRTVEYNIAQATIQYQTDYTLCGYTTTQA